MPAMIYQKLCRNTHFQISITKEGKSNCNWHMVNDQPYRLSDLQQIAKIRTMKGDENDIYHQLFVMTVCQVWQFKIKTCNCSICVPGLAMACYNTRESRPELTLFTFETEKLWK